MLNTRKRRPTHPGEVLREDVLPGLGATQGAFAELLGVSRRTVVELLAERRAISPDMAHRLARVLDTTPEGWLTMQAAVDLWDDYERHKDAYKALRPAHRAVA
jgi:addiction module HigA family antidote